MSGKAAMTNDPAPTKPPWHLWAAGVSTLLWNGFGGFDYVMNVTRNPWYLNLSTEGQRAFIGAYPSWVTSIWATAVWGGVLGSILLLMRRRMAVIVYEVALAAFLISAAYIYVMSNGAQVNGAIGIAMTALIGAVAVFEVAYAYFVQRRGWLR
jgi:hypothetical protein